MANNDEKGFYIEPKTDCPHLKKLDLKDPIRFAQNRPCNTCKNENENWCCLACGVRYCSRYVAGHMEEHYKSNKKHCIAVSYSDFSFWCYKCDSYITHKSLQKILLELTRAKFGEEEEVEFFKEWQSAHGHTGSIDWQLPKLVTRCEEYARADQKNTIAANEFLDSPEVLEQKMAKLAELIKQSKNMITYTGAGLSKSSGIPDYATKAKNSVVNESGVPQLLSPLEAAPTLAHHILTRMEKAGYLKYWVQQNHDGLPQKAGFPQGKINEIHGAWFDPSNPVVQFSGNLRGDLFDEMLDWEKRADLCLCLGTSLSGMNADRMASTPARKFCKGRFGEQLGGTVIINLQQTKLDPYCSLRVWAKLDDAFLILAKYLELDSSMPPYPLPHLPIGEGNTFVIPFDQSGSYNPEKRMYLNLGEGSKVKIVNPLASNAGSVGYVFGRREDKSWSVALYNSQLQRTQHFAFGWWWIDAALSGSVPSIPFINLDYHDLPSDFPLGACEPIDFGEDEKNSNHHNNNDASGGSVNPSPSSSDDKNCVIM